MFVRFLKSLPMIGFAILALCTQALAQEDASANTWTNFDMTMSYSGLGFTKTQRATIDKGEVVHSTSDTSSGLMFSCLSGHLLVSIALKPQDFRDSFQKTTGRNKYKHVDMRLDGGERKGLGVWIHKPSLDAVSSRKRSQAAKLYNAVVRRQTIMIYMDGKKPVTLDIPKPNRTFAEFGAECGIGKFAKKK